MTRRETYMMNVIALVFGWMKKGQQRKLIEQSHKMQNDRAIDG